MKTIEEIQLAAYDFEQIPDADLPAPEALLWYELRDVYDRYKNHIIPKAVGESEKQKAMQRYHNNRSTLDTAETILRHNAKMWAAIEIAADAYRLDRTLENADAFITAVYGAGIKQKGENADADT